jgi:hypothetical protein
MLYQIGDPRDTKVATSDCILDCFIDWINSSWEIVFSHKLIRKIHICYKEI